MGYPQDTLKIVIGGKADTDIWRTTVDFKVTSAGGTPSAAALNALITNKIQPRALTFWNAIRAFDAAVFTYNTVLVYYYPAGSTVAASAGIATLSDVPGTGAGSYMSPRTALVVSKITGFAGRHNRGRAYIPITAAAGVGSNLQAPVGTCNTVASAYAAMLTGMNADDWATDAGLSAQKAIVTSAASAVPGKNVTVCRVDSILDTQRRRTNKDSPSAVSAVTV